MHAGVIDRHAQAQDLRRQPADHLAILAEAIEDYAANVTRFVLIGRTPATQDEATKTSLVFSLKSTPGALFKALSVFALRDINLTKLESRPIEGRPWEYAFYADISGDASEVNVANALNHLREMCETVVVLGSYAAANEPSDR